MVYGTSDPVGSVDIWKRAMGQIPRAELHLVDGGGHMNWFDDPNQVGGRVGHFLTA